jgi:uncharacterized tellurite resistance protein B-like protein
MFDSIIRRLTQPKPDRLPKPDAQLALAALLVRVARADDHYTDHEAAHIDRALAGHFAVSPSAASALRTKAEVLETVAPDTVVFTRALKSAVMLEDRMGLVQAMWSVALADGLRDAHEERLLRLVANLLGLSDVQSALARQKAAP